ncbi:Dyp-type peroxidase [Caballeronia sp. ATUFL_F1_KS39]|uniref:Dyp-type peroxidase n=1 Tax=Caballeronia sp. ATUFL_F1_KS39 TaxID=2921766 RepID=UPI002027AAF4|nr:Dyp-type peroxidase [Caballeronia sp. ATUFL_F1_KS39]
MIEEPILDTDEIQGNILEGFNKDFQGVLPIWFGDDVRQTKEWLAELLPSITWLSEVHGFRKALKAGLALTGEEPIGLTSLWTNISLSWPGIAKLTPQAGTFDPIFKAGLPDATGRIFDPLTIGTPGEASSWKFGQSGNVPDALIIVAGDVAGEVDACVAATIEKAAKHAVACRHPDIGRNLKSYGRPELAGHEHFGFKDGVSQPAVRGRVSQGISDYLTDRPTNQEASVAIPELSTTGAPLVWPGEFVLGYDCQAGGDFRTSRDPYPLGPKPYADVPNVVGPWWARNGSFLVYRRLRQDVRAFQNFLEATRAQLRQSAEFSTLTSDHVGAMLVGRWKSGAPILLATDHDDKTLADDDKRNNAFDFNELDALGTICPQAAHIRKVNPRKLGTDQGPPPTTLNHRILRRGIAYGPPLATGASDADAGADRGLLFLSYQASIGEQFELLLQKWANNTANPNAGLAPPPGNGIDPILGQLANSPQRYIILGASQQRVNLPHTPWVTATGGGYFFTPSKTALEEVLLA